MATSRIDRVPAPLYKVATNSILHLQNEGTDLLSEPVEETEPFAYPRASIDLLYHLLFGETQNWREPQSFNGKIMRTACLYPSRHSNFSCLT